MNTAKMRIAGVLVGGIAALVLTACNSSDNAAPTTTSAPATSTTIAKPPAKTTPAPAPVVDPGTKTATPTAKPKPEANVIGPKSWGKVKLGMTFAEAKAAGLVRGGEQPPDGCQTYPLYVDGKRDGYVHITANAGIETIAPDSKVSTPEGVTVGWTAAQVKKVYPDLSLHSVNHVDRAIARVPGNSGALYQINFKNGAVEGFILEVFDQHCYG